MDNKKAYERLLNEIKGKSNYEMGGIMDTIGAITTLKATGLEPIIAEQDRELKLYAKMRLCKQGKLSEKEKEVIERCASILGEDITKHWGTEV